MSTEKELILICDDEEKVREKWKQDLLALPGFKKRWEIDFLEETDFIESIRQLEKRRIDGGGPPSEDNRIDAASIFIVDYDLRCFTSEEQNSSYITGENVAYLARCYSSCGLIITLNRFGQNTFDLTLRGHPESFADLNLGGDQIANPGLWGYKTTGFRPWYWPSLPSALPAFEKRVAELMEGGMDRPILDFLGFAPEVIVALPRTFIEFIESRGSSEENPTFAEFVIGSGSALRRKDQQSDELLRARIAAARIWKWLERCVLPGQDILVDAPHLVGRFPSLLKESRGNIKNWNATAQLDEPRSLDCDRIADAVFERSHWLSRPVWHWSLLRSHPAIDEVKDPWSVEPAGVVFCEDLSQFLPRSATRAFIADLESVHVRRFVIDAKSKEASKVFPNAKGKDPQNFRKVEYRPRIRYSID